MLHILCYYLIILDVYYLQYAYVINNMIFDETKYTFVSRLNIICYLM